MVEPALAESLSRGAAAFGWERRTMTPGSMRDGETLIGWGVGSSTYPVHALRSQAIATSRADGTAVVASATHDLGTGTYTIMAQIAAGELGLPIDDVRFELGDTALPEAPMSVGSMTAASVSPAVSLAARHLRDAAVMLAVAEVRSPLYGIPPEDIAVAGGRLFLRRDPSTGDAHGELLRRAGRETLAATADVEPADLSAFAAHSFGAHIVEVRIEPDIGRIRVSRVVVRTAWGASLTRSLRAVR